MLCLYLYFQVKNENATFKIKIFFFNLCGIPRYMRIRKKFLNNFKSDVTEKFGCNITKGEEGQRRSSIQDF